MTGDLTGYTIGHKKGREVLRRWAFARRQYEKHRKRLEYYFDHYGGATVFVGRFVAVGRAFVPFTAGLSGMRLRNFVPIAVLGGIGVGVGHRRPRLYLGIQLETGRKMAQVAQRRDCRTGDPDCADGRDCGGRPHGVRPSSSHAWKRHLTGRYGFNLTPFVDFVRNRFSPRSYLGLHLTIGLIAMVALAWLFGGIVDAISDQGPLGGLDRTVALFVAAQRTPALDSAVSVIAMLANPIWLAFIVGVGAVSYARRREASLSIAALLFLAGSYVLAYGLQAMFAKHAANQSELELVNGFAGFPSAALTASTAAYGMLAYLLAAETQSWRLQTLSVAGAFYFIALIGFAGIYSGLALSAIVGGFALGGCWLAICVTGSRTYNRMRIAGIKLA